MTSDRPNVLFVVIDQFRADLLHGALAAHVDLPNLRGLMAESVSFTAHYSVTAPCGPARASLLTGQYAMNHGAVRNGTPMPHDTPNIARELRKAGYLPLLFGYTDSAPDPRHYPPGDPVLRSFEQVLPGFVEVLEMRLEESWPWRAHLASRGYDVPPYPLIFRPTGPRPDDPALYSAEDSDTAFLADRTIEALAARPPGWFAHVTFLRPHPPLVAPAPYNRMYDPAALPPPAEGLPGHPFDAPSLELARRAGLTVGIDTDRTPETVQILRAIYLGLATEVDHHLGRILDFLRRSGLDEDTLIVVTADHGEMLGDRGLWGKSSYHDACYHVPLIIRAPGMRDTAGRAVAEITESVDVAPTILDLLGCDIPDTMNGQSLRPFLDGQRPADWRQAGFSELSFGNPLSPTPRQAALGLDFRQANLAVLRGSRHTLVHFNGGLPPLLFDRSGAGEGRDLAGSSAAQPVLLEMTRAMLDHRMTRGGGRVARTAITSAGARRI